jgi:L-threonylcarbamoyladenylate synthase
MNHGFDVRSMSEAAKIVARGGVIAFRTDTFYGLGADPFNRDAVQKIKQLKGREDRKPILIVISEWDQIEELITKRTRTFNTLAKRFWPGPLTLIGKAASEVSEDITAGTATVGVRLPGDNKVRELVRECGGALTATSANPSDQQPAKTAQEVEKYFGAAIDLIVDGGPASTDLPSTVVDVSELAPRLIREGVIAWADIRKLLRSG